MTKDELSTLSDVCEKITTNSVQVKDMDLCMNAISRVSNRQELPVTIHIGDGRYRVWLHRQHILDAIQKSQDLAIEIAGELNESLNQAPAATPQ